MADKLTVKQENFCQAYVRLGDKSAAYREAYDTSGMKPETVNNNAYKMFENNDIVARVEELHSIAKKVADEKFGITAETMLRHLNILRNARIDEYVTLYNEKVLISVDEDDNPVFGEVLRVVFKPFSELTKEQLMCIESVKETRYGLELKLHGKEWTIEKINKHIGFYEKDNMQKPTVAVANIDYSKLSTEALIEIEKATNKE